ncbi:MAG: type II toxin-antitoxin system VapC family toxin [Candidatus Geothermarchaeales archaeon]
MQTYFIDSNVFFYAKILDREYGEACVKILRGIAEGEIRAATSALIIIELVNALRKYGLGKEARGVVDATFSLDIAIYEVDPTDVRIAMKIFDEFEISPYDCVHAAVMKRVGTNYIISADKDFDEIKWLKRLDPKRYGS